MPSDALPIADCRAHPSDVPDYGLLNDLVWSDPSDTALEWEDNERGVSYCYGKAVINAFLATHVSGAGPNGSTCTDSATATVSGCGPDLPGSHGRGGGSQAGLHDTGYALMHRPL